MDSETSYRPTPPCKAVYKTVSSHVSIDTVHPHFPPTISETTLTMLTRFTLLFSLSLANALLVPRDETTATLVSYPSVPKKTLAARDETYPSSTTETPHIVLSALAPRGETTATSEYVPTETPLIPRGEPKATPDVEPPNPFNFKEIHSLLSVLNAAGITARGETTATPTETPSIVLRGLAPYGETTAIVDASSIGTANLVAATSLPNGAEVESGEGIKKKTVSADFAPKMENGAVAMRGGMTAMVSFIIEEMKELC
jgi:hypothetical protein